MTDKLIHKELGGMEDLAFGEGQEAQVRNGLPVNITRIKLLYLIRSDAELAQLDGAKFPFVLKVAQDGVEFFRYNGSSYAPVQTGITPYAPTLGLHFVGIYNDMAELQDGIKRPDNNLQAIVLTPSEKYYHSVGGAWVELAPVGAFHPSYLGAYDSVADLNTAEPNAPINSLAIVAKVFWYKEASGWVQMQAEDLQSLAQRMNSLTASMQTLESDMQFKISGIHVEDEDNHAYDDITDINIKGGRLEDQQGSSVTIVFEPSVGVSTGQELDSKFYKGPTIEFPGATVTPRNNGQILTIYPDKRHMVNGLKVDSWAFDNDTFAVKQEADGSLTVGLKSASIAVRSGNDVYAGVTTLDFAGCAVKDLGSGAIQITPSVSWKNAGETQTFSGSVVVEPPLRAKQVKEDVVLEIDHDAYEPKKAPGLLAYVPSNTYLIGKAEDKFGHLGAFFPTEKQVSDEEFILAAPQFKAYGFQEWDQLDPNVTGGDAGLVGIFAGFRGYAEEDGFIRIYAAVLNQLGQPEGYLTDTNGHIVGAERSYKTGEPLHDPSSPLVALAVCDFTALEYIKFFVETSFDEGVACLDPADFPTGILIQGLSANSATGDARQQFELDTGIKVNLSKHYLGPGRFDATFVLQHSVPERPTDVSTSLPDGFSIQLIGSSMRFGVANGTLTIRDNGDIVAFAPTVTFDSEETRLLQGKQIHITGSVASPDNAVQVYVMYWSGVPDVMMPVISGYGNGGIEFHPDWHVITDQFIAESPTSQRTPIDLTVTVPTAANNYAIVLATLSMQSPNTIYLDKLKVDVPAPFTGWYVGASDLSASKHLMLSPLYAEMVQDNQGYKQLRYTINNVANQPMPCGLQKSGKLKIDLDPAVNVIAGSMARGGEGAWIFGSSGITTIAPVVRMYNEQSIPATTQFVWNTVLPNGSLVPIEDSRSNMLQLPGQSLVGRDTPMRAFKLDVKAGDKIALTVTGDNPDCAFLQSDSPSRPLLKTKVSQEATVTVPDSALYKSKGARISYITPNNAELTQLLTADNVPRTVLFNTVAMSTPSIIVDVNSGIFTFVDDTVGLFTLSAQAIRKVGGSGSADWAIFIETSTDGQGWTAIPGSARRVTFTSQEANEHRPVDFTLPVQFTPGSFFRLRHVTTSAVKQVGITSLPAQGGAPSSAGIIVGFYCNTKG
ncbi:MAG: hypothetical protein ACRDC4_11665 [Plesiomonas sp.]